MSPQTKFCPLGIKRLVLLLAACAIEATKQTYIDRALQAMDTLNREWYNSCTGSWSQNPSIDASSVTTLADFGFLGLAETKNHNIEANIKKTIEMARDHGDLFTGLYVDEGLWAIALIRSYDFIGDWSYLESVVRLFEDMHTGVAPDGGVYFGKNQTFISPWASELYLSVAASLANRIPKNDSYKSIAKTHWQWFSHSGLINNQHLVDSDTITAQGEILGGLSELAQATGDYTYLQVAEFIAMATIHKYSTSGNQAGVLMPPCESQERCYPGDHNGIFIRNLHYLYRKWPNVAFQDFILANAESLWQNDRNEDSEFGFFWTGPYVNTTPAVQRAALDALVAAIVV